jgi:hypothetical protein
MIRYIRQLIGHVTSKFQWEEAKNEDGKPKKVKGGIPVFRAQLISSNKFMPGGPHANVRGTYVKHSGIARQMNAMHAKWEAARRGKAASPT